MIKTIITNWRDIVAFLLIGIGLVILSGVIDYVSGWLGFKLILPAISNYLQGFSRFVGANLAASVIGVALWPTINRFGNHSFKDGWEAIPLQGQCLVYIGLFVAESIVAAICFSA